jgi:MFS family permease
MGVVERLLFIYLTGELQGSIFLCGLTVGVTVLLELPIFAWSERLIARFGDDAMILTAMSAYVVRVYGYTLLTADTRYYILPLELLHGITFACYYSAAQQFVRDRSHKAWLGATQNILAALLSCLGGGTGSIVGGWVLETYGARVMYRYAAYIISALIALHLVAMCWRRAPAGQTPGEHTLLVNTAEAGGRTVLHSGSPLLK